ncbi:hypothetical protein PAXRUDRAFT_832598 [Paxillus rubicundulus Ve08.2h10]|uniref:Uncharacterized protein n=1 Tax=Paxillus rubicundulus Ve08.2h10 TaxID=930991 RepID=A0A0D0DQS2_9AGAM|nr:hypothetical protein PAXRUDRAFT_832598 [Paxillus rubicundulus Ve08.2h10]
MSVSKPTTSSIVPIHPELDPPFIKFPPFPKPPEGVTIMPFKDFKARGIQLFSESKQPEDDEDELDALGIPTVELRIKHATDACKSITRKKRKKKKSAMMTEAVPVKKLAWYDEWEEGEDLRVAKGKYDRSISPADRFFQSAYDFRTGRPWPPVASGLNNLWDQFRMFVGLLIDPSVFRKANANICAFDPSPDSESDDEDEPEDPAMKTHGTTTANDSDSRPAKRLRSYEGSGDDEENVPFDPHRSHEETMDEKIAIFLADPEKAVRIFLSSYMREHGLIWSERSLNYAPRLISFFLSFVLRNRILPEQSYQRGLKRALETINLAKKELPLTHKVGKMLPDAFNGGCRECFGRQGGMNWSINVTDTSATDKKEDSHISVIDVSTGAKMQVELLTEAQIQVKETIEDMEVALDSFPISVTPVGTQEDSTVWGAGWATEPGGWDQNTWNAEPMTGGDEAEDGQGASNDALNDANASWADPNTTWNTDPPSLITFLGPSVFPLTHTTGIIECSTRRVSAIYPPPSSPSADIPSLSRQKKHQGMSGAVIDRTERKWAPSPSGVEVELDARFAKVVLEPWGREEGDISRPEISYTSRGPVVDPKSSDTLNASATASAGAKMRKDHNPHADSITLLVEPSLVETLSLVPGLGLGAMWIEIVRQEDVMVGPDEPSGTGDQMKDTYPTRFWYHEDVTGIFPSFYTPRAKGKE